MSQNKFPPLNYGIVVDRANDVAFSYITATNEIIRRVGWRSGKTHHRYSWSQGKWLYKGYWHQNNLYERIDRKHTSDK